MIHALWNLLKPDPLVGPDNVVADRLRSLALKARERQDYRACDRYSSAAVMVECQEYERARNALKGTE